MRPAVRSRFAPLALGLVLLAIGGSALLLWELPDPEIAALVAPGEAPSSAPVAPAGGTSTTEGISAAMTERETTAMPSDVARTEIVILRADTQEPVPGATVSWWQEPDELDGDTMLERWLQRSEVELHTREAARVVANAEGRVLVADVEPGFFVVAAAPGLWGWARFAADRQGQAKVLVAPDADVRVRVVDVGGAPVGGATVALRDRRLTYSTDLLTARTGDDGFAVLRHAAAIVATAEDRGVSLVIALQGLFADSIEQHVDASRLGGEPVTLTVGPNGACEVAVVDGGGQLLSGPFVASLRFAGAGANTRAETIHTRTGGPVVFGHVAAGHRLALTVTREGANAPLVAETAGPRAGERVRLTVNGGEGAAIVRGRVLEIDGAPAAHRAVRVRVELATGEPIVEGVWQVRTTADGRFAIDTVAEEEAHRGRVLAVRCLDARGVEVAGARRPLPSLLPVGVHELGDFRLVDAQVLLAGLVSDMAGHPVAGATITPAIVPGNAAGELDAAPLPPSLPSARSDGHGRFEIRSAAGGITAAHAITLTADKQDLVGEPVVARLGDSEVRLVLGAASAIEGKVLLDPSLVTSTVFVRAFRAIAGASEPGPDGRQAIVGTDGSFRVGGLASGDYVVRFVHASSACELAHIEMVTVRAGETARDRRLDPIDLRQGHRLLVLDPCDENGKLVFGARAVYRPSGDAASKWMSGIVVDGCLQLLSDGRALDVAVTAPGWQAAELEGVATSQRVTFRRGARLRLTLAGAVPALEAPLRLGARLTPVRAGRFAASVESVAGWFDARGTFVCETPAVGELRVELIVASAEARMHLVPEHPATLAVADHAFEQEFQVRVDAARVAAAVRSLRDDR